MRFIVNETRALFRIFEQGICDGERSWPRIFYVVLAFTFGT